MSSSKSVSIPSLENELKEFGVIDKIVRKIFEETQIEWKTDDFFSVIKDMVSVPLRSPLFFFNDRSWCLKLGPKVSFPYVSVPLYPLYISTDSNRNYTLEYSLSLKKNDGSMKSLTKGIMKGNELNSAKHNLRLSQILPQNVELEPQNVPALVCSLKRDITHSTQPTTSEKSTALKLINLDKLSENFKDLFGDKESCDVTLKVMDKEYKAHKSVLIARSSVFAATFRHDTSERQTGIITMSDCDPESFEVFLEYLYCGKLEQMSYCSALNLYYTSDKYDVEELKTFCVKFLMQNLTVEDVCEVVVFADKYDEIALFSAVQSFFNQNARKVLATSQWACLMKENYRLAHTLLIEMSKEKLPD